MFDGFVVPKVDAREFSSTRGRQRWACGAATPRRSRNPADVARHRAAAGGGGLTMVAADLRGGGAGCCPHRQRVTCPSPMRGIAANMIAVVRAIGRERFAVSAMTATARSRTGSRLTGPDRVERLAVLDMLPGADAVD